MRADRLILFIAATALAHAASAQVLQTGSVTPGHVAQWATNGVIQDGGAVPGGGGTVTSVGLTAPSWLTVTGSPITTSGTLALTGTSESANLFLASPNGSSGALTPRTIVAADLPGGLITGLTTNVIPKATGAATLGNSSIADAGSGVTIGSPTGGAQGAGTLNMTGCFINGVACATSGGGGVTWPANNDIVVSNGTSSPAGLAPVNNDIVYATGGAWAALTSADNGVLVTGGSGVPSISSTLPSGLTIPAPTITSSFTATGLVTNADLAAQTANTVLGAVTAASPSGLSVPSCSTSTSALTWTSGTGFGCHTITPGTGTVTSVAQTVPTGFTIGGSPVTTSGTLAIGLSTESANTVWAGPSSGAAAAPGFRALVGADLPNPSATTLGGVESIAAVTHDFLTSISTSGVPAHAQPDFTDLSGSLAAPQMPALTGDATSSAGTTATTVGAIQGRTVPSGATTDGQLLIGNTSTGNWSKATLTAGTNVTITNSGGGITIAAAGGGTGCSTSGSAGDLLTDNGAGGCASQADWILSSNQLLATKNAAITSPPSTTLLTIAGADTVTDGVQVYTFGSNPQFSGFAAGGTGASKSAVTDQTSLVGMFSGGWDGSAYGTGASFEVRAAQTYSGTAHGSKDILFYVPLNSTTKTQGAVLEGDGTWFIGSNPSSTTHNTGAGSVNAGSYFVDHSGSPAALAIGDLAPVTGPVIAGRVTNTSGAMSTPYTPSNGTDTTVAMAHGTFTAGDGVKANDTTGTIVDSGAAVGLTHFDIGYIAGVNMTTNPTEVSIALPVGMTITSMIGHVGAAVGGTATIDIYEAPSGTACASGTKLTNTTSFNANGTANTDQTLAGTTSTITSGDRLCLVAAGAGWSSSVGSGGITVWAHL